ncbi:hypothetical protein FPZ12_029535 [Amycolatopsis acidicola]|uniref:Uncharacterized protein n=1 Tax=Amycolatopsis acidicola TaxID=2596893 RepID=A0A5N0UX44_9PSEU|nr:hypothetical protein [Amycolatopsis acidicola]KAA9155540.1 hypothetical protein FPZ12_029535 [Amycolatopsis acidicola]
MARDWYLSLQVPSIACYLQQTDVAQARVIAHILTEQLNRPGGPVANALSPIFSAMDSLLTSEGARRRLSIEIDRREVTAPTPLVVADRRDRLAKGA